MNAGDRKILVFQQLGSTGEKAMKPTASGYKSDNPKARDKYLQKLSGPLLDQIDIHVEVPSVPYRELTSKISGTTSATMRDHVQQARKVQDKRFAGQTSNARMDTKQLKAHCD